MAEKHNLNGTNASYLLLAAWSTVPYCHSRSWCDRRLWPGPSCALWWLLLCTRPSALWWLLTTFLKWTSMFFVIEALIYDYGWKENANLKSMFLFISQLSLCWGTSNKRCCLKAWAHKLYSSDKNQIVRNLLLLCTYLQNWLLVWCYLWHGLHQSTHRKTDQPRKALSRHYVNRKTWQQPTGFEKSREFFPIVCLKDS